METSYPQPVNDWLEKFHQSLIESEFYRSFEIDPNIGKQAVVNQIGPQVFKSWIDSNEILVSQEEIETMLLQVESESAIIGLIDKGIMESFTDSEGKEIFRLTPLGLKVQKELSNEI